MARMGNNDWMEPLLRSGALGALAVLNARYPRIRSRVLSIPSFASAWITTEEIGRAHV